MLNRDQWDTVGTGSSRCGRKIRSKWRKISPAGVGVKLSSFVIQIPTKICFHGASQSAVIAKMVFAERSLKTSAFWRYQTLSGYICLIPGNKQLFVEVLWKVLVLLFYRIFWIFSVSRGFFAGHYSDVNVDVLGRTIPEEEMFLVCWNLQVGVDIYALYNRVVLSCSAGRLCKLWKSCEWWQQILAGGDQRPFRRKYS